MSQESVNLSAMNIQGEALNGQSSSSNPTWSNSVGNKVGHCILKYSSEIKMICIGALVITVVYLLLRYLATIAEAEVVEANTGIIGAATNYAIMMKHQKCKARGGCSRRCPFITEDDPRVVMSKQVDALESLTGVITQGAKEEKIAIDIAVNKISPAKQNDVIKDISTIQPTKDQCVSNIIALTSQSRSLDAAFGLQEVSANVVNAKNQMSAIEATALIYKNAFVAGSIRCNSMIMGSRLEDIPDVDQKRIVNYDEKLSEAKAHIGGIKTKYEDNVLTIINDKAFMLNYNALLQNNMKSDEIINSLAYMLSKVRDLDQTVREMMAKFEIVSDIFVNCLKRFEGFSNDLPGKLNNEQMSSLISDGDYATALVRTALEPEVVTNHRKFAKERSAFDSGGGVPAVRDDDNDVVPWAGLYGRPNYRKSNGDSIEKSSEPLKSIPSDNPEDLMRDKVAKWVVA